MGYLVEANKSYSLVFEMIKVKMFGDNQRTTKLKILNKRVSLNNTKFSYDKAYIWAIKALECLDATDSPILVIETLNQSAKAFTEKSLFEKAKPLAEKSFTLSNETFGKESMMCANSLVVYANYLSKTDQRDKANDLLETALKIVAAEEGERSVAAAKILGQLAKNNYRIQSYSTKDYTVASEQAEEAVQVIEEKINKTNFLVVLPKNMRAAIIRAKSYVTEYEEEKSKLLAEAEELGADCLAIAREELGDFNPLTATLMTNMGITYRNTGRNPEAKELLIRSLAIKEKILGEDQAVAASHWHLAAFYRDNIKDFETAEHHYKISIQMIEKVIGSDHSSLGSSYDSLIILYQKTKDSEKEKEMWDKKEAWEALQEKKKEDKDEEEKEEEKEKERTLEEIINFVTTSDMTEP